MSQIDLKNFEEISSNASLIFIDWFIPGYKAGGPIQSVANMINRLSDKQRFFIVTRNTDYCDTIPYPNIVPNKWIQHASNIWIFYFSNDALSYKNIKQILQKSNCETIYLNGIFSTKFTLFPLYICRQLNYNTYRIIIASRGMLAPSALAIKRKKKMIFLLFSKKIGLYKKVIFHATNADEKKQIENVFGLKNEILIAPNLAKPNKNKSFVSVTKKENTLNIISVARIAPEKNLLYALQVLQLVKSNIVFSIYGTAYDTSYLELCKKEINSLPKNITVNYLGAINNEEVPKIIAENNLMFMPTQGENFGHIILETLQASRPVLISNLTPFKNLEANNCGFDLPLNDKQLFANKIDLLANMNNTEYNKLCEASFNYAEQICNNTDDEMANRKLF